MDRSATKPLTLGETLGYGAIGFIVFFGVWSLLSFTGAVPRQFLPAPHELAARFLDLLTTPFAGATLPRHLASSFFRFGCGFLLGAAVGIPLGLLMGWSRTLDEIVTPVFDALRFIAPIAWVPFAALWFGTGLGGPILIIFAGAFPPCLINAYRGARFVGRPLVEAAQMLGTGNLRIIVEVLLPASTASIIAGLRVSAGLGWQSLIGVPADGRAIWRARRQTRSNMQNLLLKVLATERKTVMLITHSWRRRSTSPRRSLWSPRARRGCARSSRCHSSTRVTRACTNSRSSASCARISARP